MLHCPYPFQPHPKTTPAEAACPTVTKSSALCVAALPSPRLPLAAALSDTSDRLFEASRAPFAEPPTIADAGILVNPAPFPEITPFDTEKFPVIVSPVALIYRASSAARSSLPVVTLPLARFVEVIVALAIFAPVTVAFAIWEAVIVLPAICVAVIVQLASLPPVIVEFAISAATIVPSRILALVTTLEAS